MQFCTDINGHQRRKLGDFDSLTFTLAQLKFSIFSEHLPDWFGTAFASDIYGLQRMNLNNFGDHHHQVNILMFTILWFGEHDKHYSC